MAVFLHKANEEAKAAMAKLPAGSPAILVDESQFRYSGPRPKSKEAGIVMLADSVEAASRSVDNPTAATLNGLIENIFETKIEDGQLDECALSFKELATVRQSFIASLSTILHGRIRYPGKEAESEDTDRKPAE